jgi:2-amino-4-hydroxy-6-hydroxymethyldihydropteridine diphosphokinase
MTLSVLTYWFNGSGALLRFLTWRDVSLVSPLGREHSLMKRVYLSFGSNLGDREARIRRAFELLSANGVHVRKVSSFYSTEPVDYRPQPWFVNCVVQAETDQLPVRLLHTCQSVERAVGRRPGIVKGPRPIDIDILLYENAVIHSAALVVPHERMTERRFVLIPLKEIAGALRHPVTKRTVSEILDELRDTRQVVKLRSER